MPRTTPQTGAPGRYVDTHTFDAATDREWKADAALRAEFSGNFNAYAAYRKAHAKGLVRIHQKGA